MSKYTPEYGASRISVGPNPLKRPRSRSCGHGGAGGAVGVRPARRLLTRN